MNTGQNVIHRMRRWPTVGIRHGCWLWWWRTVIACYACRGCACLQWGIRVRWINWTVQMWMVMMMVARMIAVIHCAAQFIAQYSWYWTHTWHIVFITNTLVQQTITYFPCKNSRVFLLELTYVADNFWGCDAGLWEMKQNKMPFKKFIGALIVLAMTVNSMEFCWN